MATTSSYTLHAGTPPVGALTTIWSPPASCLPLVNHWLEGRCLPSSGGTYSQYNKIYYSPAICPSGYTVACTRPTTSFGIGGSSDFYGPPLEPSETAQLCCPSSLICDRAVDFYCTRFAANGDTDPTNLAQAIQIRWQATDLPAFETPPITLSPTTVTSTSTNLVESGTGAATSAKGQYASGSSGLSKCAAVGIGVSVGIVILSFITAVLFFLKRRQSRIRSSAHQPALGYDEQDANNGNAPEAIANTPEHSTHDKLESDGSTSKHRNKLPAEVHVPNSIDHPIVELPVEPWESKSNIPIARVEMDLASKIPELQGASLQPLEKGEVANNQHISRATVQV
ncbi:uncharacterized protein EI97DRAFT_438856 [Westerdykella ornata]|uniref:Mid2 domain-containing protein n=1 Tax=Westerdykella ornata TaxID=318751 RepID=A0A6A6K081_WESOR|nr:uncharacterized protein EI97DRAFT_438856 [Westerdykella ornata]KAF2281528.1 hypothetical protein EI97DRAFT_438856 [Westerdykella ornata]